MSNQKGIKFFIATDKPLEKTAVNEFCPYRKVADDKQEDLNEKALTLLDIFREVNSEVKRRFKKGWEYYADVLPYDLKNTDKIPDDVLRDHIRVVLLDLFALRKDKNKERLFNLIELWKDLNNSGPYTPIFDPIFIFNNRNHALSTEIRGKFDEFSCPNWPICECDEDLKQQIINFMSICNHPVKYSLVTSITSLVKNVHVLKEIIRIIQTSPEKKLATIRIKNIANIDAKSGRIISIDKEKTLKEFGHEQEYGQWFIDELSKKATRKPEEYFYAHASGFGVFDTTRSKFNYKNRDSLRSLYDNQIQNMIDMERVLDNLIEQLEFKIIERDFQELTVKVRLQLRENLTGMQYMVSPEDFEKKGLATKIKWAQTALEGKLFCNVVKHEKISDSVRDALNSLGLDEAYDVRILPNSMYTLNMAKSAGKVVKVSQIRTEKGNLELIKLPFKF